jgi:alkylated DNA repair dioxygenase AlkB
MNAPVAAESGRTIADIGEGLRYCGHFLPEGPANRLLQDLLREVPWQQSTIRIFGRSVLEPRLSCWMGETEAVYRYSGTEFAPKPWIASVVSLRRAVEDCSGQRFNSVLLNFYRDGRDAMGWHSDDEPELGDRPVIASVSLGAERRFLLRERRKGARSRALTLGHGSLLLMHGDLQQRCQHALPRTLKPVDARVNLTFRNILQAR